MEGNYGEAIHHEKKRKAPSASVHQSRGVYITRLILRILSTLTSLAIVGVLVSAIHTYTSTRHVTASFSDGQGRFNVWPTSLKMHPTYILLGAAAAAAGISLLLSLASVVGAVRHMTKVGNVATVVVSTVSLAIWVGITVYYGIWDTKETKFDLLSWTCKHSEYEYKEIDFSEICMEMRFSFWSAVGLAALEAINLALFVGWMIHQRRGRGYRKM